MKIASQHAWKDKDYSPRHEWPGETLVQWGGSGLVLGRNSYMTAFFEAFPDKRVTSSGGFIRGEGATIAEAEDKAFAKFLKENACDHLWGPEKYINGGQLCRHCRAFRSGEMKPIVSLGDWRKPVGYYETTLLNDDINSEDKYIRQLRLRAKVFGIKSREES